MLTSGYAIVNVDEPWMAAGGPLDQFWAAPASRRRALAPLLPVEGCGFRELTDDRQLFEYRCGPWLTESPLLDSLLQVLAGGVFWKMGGPAA